LIFDIATTFEPAERGERKVTHTRPEERNESRIISFPGDRKRVRGGDTIRVRGNSRLLNERNSSAGGAHQESSRLPPKR